MVELAGAEYVLNGLPPDDLSPSFRPMITGGVGVGVVGVSLMRDGGVGGVTGLLLCGDVSGACRFTGELTWSFRPLTVGLENPPLPTPLP